MGIFPLHLHNIRHKNKIHCKHVCVKSDFYFKRHLDKLCSDTYPPSFVKPYNLSPIPRWNVATVCCRKPNMTTIILLLLLIISQSE